MHLEQDTIVAIATPPGRGGIGVVRLSGPQAGTLLSPLLRMRGALEERKAHFGYIVDPATGDVVDECLALFFRGPRSYTGEDVLEISAHGAPVLLDLLVRSAVAAGARLAEPGEFTQRAFLAGRLDLTQAEAVHELVGASTLQQARVAAAQLGGAISQAVAPAKELLLELIAELQAGIDFAEDDVDVLAFAEIGARIGAMRQLLAPLSASFGYGRLLREGFTLAIVGRPNAGKSSLFNRLLERERAIVTAAPGTTRDPIAERLAIGGIPVELVDTAGLRDAPADEAEAEGMRRSRVHLADADLVLHVLDATAAEDGSGADLLAGNRPHLTIVNKVDLAAANRAFPADAIYVSARTGAGLDELRRRLEASLHSGPASLTEAPVVTNLRQQEALSGAIASLCRAAEAAETNTPHEFLLLDLHESLSALDSLTGQTHSEEILHRIFAGFCIGK